MQVLVLNSGSSSIKYQLLDDALVVRASGIVERIGEPRSRATHRRRDAQGAAGETHQDVHVPDHEAGFASIVAALGEAGLAAGIGAIGHRVVHGGAAFSAPTVIDDRVVSMIRDQIPLAPLHNPANLTGIEVARDLRPDLPQVAVFDTAFHATLAEHVYRYALPVELADTHGIRRYGFHGTSHAYVARRAADALGRPLAQLALITLHLGNGASVTAIDGGVSVETSMGLSPLEGLVMGTRSGDLDPAVVLHLQRHAGLGVDELDVLLNRRSGLLGLCGQNDLRSIEQAASAGDAAATLAIEIYCHRIRKYVGAYAATLGRLDALVFTAGVGENAAGIRARVCHDLGILGVELDEARNRDARASDAADGVVPLHAASSRAAVLAVATDEEREIAIQTRAVLGVTATPTAGVTALVDAAGPPAHDPDADRIDPGSVFAYASEAHRHLEQIRRGLDGLDRLGGLGGLGNGPGAPPAGGPGVDRYRDLVAHLRDEVGHDLRGIATDVQRATALVAPALGGAPVRLVVDTARADAPLAAGAAPPHRPDSSVDVAERLRGHLDSIRQALEDHLTDLEATDWTGATKRWAVEAVADTTAQCVGRLTAAAAALGDALGARPEDAAGGRDPAGSG